MSSLKDTEICVDADGEAWLVVGGKLSGLAPPGRYRVTAPQQGGESASAGALKDKVCASLLVDPTYWATEPLVKLSDAEAELASLRAEVAELAQQRGDLAARVLELQRGRHPTIEECEAAGRGPSNYPGKVFDEGGLPDTPDERARFEAYMRGHCWEIGAYDKALGAYDSVQVRCLYGLWRDRGALPTVNVASDSQPSE